MENCIPTKRLRRKFKEISEENYVSKDALGLLGVFVNDLVGEIIDKSTDLTIHRDAITVKEDDVRLAIEHMGLEKFLYEEEDE